MSIKFSISNSQLFPTARQDDVDVLLLKQFNTRVKMHPADERAQLAMQDWHEDPKSEGRMTKPRRKLFW
jgi:hypothetical protein